MFQWLRAFAQTTTYLGVVMIAIIWGGAAFLANEAHEHAYESGLRQGSNLTRIFEEYISRVIRATDSQLLALRELYERDRRNFDLTPWVDGAKFQNELTIQFVLIGPDGIVKSSSLGPVASVTDLSDRDHFRFHVNARKDELYVSAPVLGRLSDRSTIQLTRRLRAPDGAFDGVIGASLDIVQLERFYNSIDVGPKGVISLIGFDGIIRVRSGRDPAMTAFVGQSAAHTRVFELYRQAPTGSYWNTPKTARRFDGVGRLISYRVVEGLPLLAIVGQAESDIFREARSEAKKYQQIALILTATVLVAIGFGATREKKLLSAAANLKHSNRSLEQMNVRFDTALDNMTHGLCMFDAEKRLVVCNDRYAEMYRLPPELLKVGTPHQTIISHRVTNGLLAGGRSAGAVHAKLNQLDHLPTDAASSRIDQLADGRLIRITRQPMQGGGWVATHEDITEQKEAEARIVHLARHDALTGLANRTVLLEKMTEALVRLSRSGEAFTVFILDLDLFKIVNDSLGHPVGDALLKAVAHRLLACMRAADTVARLGGDEFAILAIVEGDQRQAAAATATRLLEAVAAPYHLDGHNLDIGTSVGIALAPQHGTDAEQLIKNADLALYRAKSEGRKTYCFFERSMETEAHNRRALEIDLRNALTQDEFELHYHPIIDIQTNVVTSVEALVRWRHPRHGMIAPDEFVPLAEETGLIDALGEHVLRKAFCEALHWPSSIRVAVNLSPVQFRRSNLVTIISEALTEASFPPQRLELEITESILLQGSVENVNTLSQLRSLGIAIVLDDFGIGYSSLSYLRIFSFDKIKIDRSFVKELSRNAECAAIVSAVAGLGRGLRVGTVAEGVETEEQLALVRAAGCSHAQGFLFGRPCPASELDFTRFEESKRQQEVA